jgi:anti-sigma factor RsiW
MSARETAPRCEDLDLDALAYGELAPSDELWARSHIALCQPCHEAHEELLFERRQFAARARNSQLGSTALGPLPSFDQLMSRAEREPVRHETRWQAAMRSWSAPWRGAVLQGVVGMFAIGMLVQVAILRPTRPTETVRSSAVTADGGTAAALDPWGESIVDCGPEQEVCADDTRQAELASAPAVDPCAGVQAPPSSLVTVDWSLQSAPALDGSVDAVCAPDAI